MVATWPVWPPASVPWATTMSQPASTAATAWRTLPHMFTTSTLLLVAQLDDLAGHAEAGHEHAGAAVDDGLRPGSTMSPGAAVSRSTPNGLSVSARTLAISSTISLVAHGRGAEAAEAAGLGHGGDEPVVRDAAHAGEHHGVLDLEDVGESGAHGRGS